MSDMLQSGVALLLYKSDGLKMFMTLSVLLLHITF